MPTIKPTRFTLLVLFILSVVIVAVVRSLQNIDPVVDWFILIVLGLVVTPVLYSIVSRRTWAGRVIAAALSVYIFLALIVASQMLEVYGLLTGLGFVFAIVGPLATLPVLVVIPIVVNPELRLKALQGLIFGAGGAIGAGLLVGILRSLQHLDPAWDVSTIAVFALLAGLGGFVTGAGLFDPRKLFTAGEPGLPRATAMGILGFLLGGLFVIVLRGLQGLDPIWDTGVGIVVIAFSTAGFFVWGIGAFDPKMSVHGEYHQPEEAESEEAKQPMTILGTEIWKVSFYLLALMIVIGFFALVPGGPGLRVTADATASSFSIGDIALQLPFGGPGVETTQLVVFLGFVIFTLLSLAVAAGLIALAMYLLSHHITETQNTEPTPEEKIPPQAVQSVGKAAGAVSDWLRQGLPKLLGQR